MTTRTLARRGLRLLRHPLLLAFYVPALLFSTSMRMIDPILPLYLREFDAGYTAVGLVVAMAPLGNMLGDIPAGMLLERLRIKHAMLIGLGIYTLSMLVFFAAPHLLIVASLQLLAGMGMATYKVAQHAYMASAVSLTSRGRALSSVGGIFRIAGFLGPAAAGYVGEALNLRAPFLLIGLLGLAAMAVLVIFLKDAEDAAPREESSPPRANPPQVDPPQPNPLRRVWRVLRDHARVLAAAGTGQVFVQTVRGGRTVVIPLYAADVLGLGAQEIGLIVSLSWGADMLFFPVSGWLMDNLGRKRAIVPSFVIQAIALLLVPLTANFWGILAAATLMGVGNGFSAGTMLTLGADLAPEGEGRGDFLGLWHLLGDLGFGVGPLLVGLIADNFVLRTAALTLAGASVMAALVFAFGVPETLDRAARDERRARKARAQARAGV